MMLHILIVKIQLKELFQIKKFKNRANEIAKTDKYDGYQRGLESMVNKFFNNKTGSEASGNENLSEKLQKPVNEKFQKKESLCQI